MIENFLFSSVWLSFYTFSVCIFQFLNFDGMSTWWTESREHTNWKFANNVHYLVMVMNFPYFQNLSYFLLYSTWNRMLTSKERDVHCHVVCNGMGGESYRNTLFKISVIVPYFNSHFESFSKCNYTYRFIYLVINF